MVILWENVIANSAKERMPSTVQMYRSGLVFDGHFLTHDTGVEATVVTRKGSFELSPEPHSSDVAIATGDRR